MAVPAGSSTSLQEGFKVYVVDRPGHGRSPIHPELHGGFPAQALTLESIAGSIHAAERESRADAPNEYQKNHNQWPGPGNVGSADLDRLAAGMGGSYVVQPAPAAGRGGAPGARWCSRGGARPGWRTRSGSGRSAAASESAAGGALNVQHLAWRQAGADLLDKIGPAIIMTHSAGGPFGLLVAEARPNLVKATVIIEGAGAAHSPVGNRWGMSTIPVTYDPPVNDPAEIKTQWVANPEPGVAGYLPAGRAGAQAAESEEHEGGVRDRRFVVRVAGQSRWRGVPEAGRRAGRGAAAGASSASRATAT